jgi:hypothetical protein
MVRRAELAFTITPASTSLFGGRRCCSSPKTKLSATGSHYQQSGGISGTTFTAIAIAVRADVGQVSPYVAVAILFEHNLSATIDFAVTAEGY